MARRQALLLALVLVLVLVLAAYGGRRWWAARHCRSSADCGAAEYCPGGGAPCAPRPPEVYQVSLNAGYGANYPSGQTYDCSSTNPTGVTAAAAAALAASLGGVVASPAQLQAALAAGAQWCSGGWTFDPAADPQYSSAYPMQDPNAAGCSGPGAPEIGVWPPDAWQQGCSAGQLTSNVTVFGVKPPLDALPAGFTVCAPDAAGPCIRNWYDGGAKGYTQWSQYD